MPLFFTRFKIKQQELAVPAVLYNCNNKQYLRNAMHHLLQLAAQQEQHYCCYT